MAWCCTCSCTLRGLSFWKVFAIICSFMGLLSIGLLALNVILYLDVSSEKTESMDCINLKPICINPGEERMWDNCSDTANSACVAIELEKISLCSAFRNVSTVPVCVEVITERIVTCGGYLLSYLCFSNYSGERTQFLKSPNGQRITTPCNDENRQICLNENGLMEICGNMVSCTNSVNIPKNESNLPVEEPERSTFDSDQKFNSTTHSSENVTLPENHYEWSLSSNANQTPLALPSPVLHKMKNSSHISPTGEIMKPSTNLETLCFKSKTGGSLSHCQSQDSDYAACYSRYQEFIGDCDGFDIGDLPVPICTEDLSNKIVICGNATNEFLCEQPDEQDSPALFRPCANEEQQLCFDTETGKTELCAGRKSKDNEEEEYRKRMEFWMTFWSEWELPKGLSTSYPADDIKMLCVSEFQNVAECDNYNNIEKACYSASYSYVGKCKELGDYEMPIPICMEMHTNKIVTCGKNTKAYVCYPPDGRKIPTRPCYDENRQLCYHDKDFVLCRDASIM